ncbi:hypothetical protein [Nocardioides marmoraquaticus]
MSEKTSARPRQVTWGAAFAVSGSLFLVVMVFEGLGSLSSVQLREQLEEAMSSSGFRVDVDLLLQVMRWSLYVTAVAAAVAFVSGIFAWQRHRGARVALSVAAVPILLTTPITGVFLGLLVAMGTTSLWSGPARDWFAGRPVREVAPRGRTAPPPTDRAPETPPAPPAGVSSGTSSVPPPHQGYGDARPAPLPVAPHHPPAPYGQHPAPYPDPTQPGGPWSSTPGDRAPAQVRVAVALTWVGGAVVALAMAATLAVWLLAPDTLRGELERTAQADGIQVPVGMLDAVVWTMVLMFGGWAVAACVLAELARRRHDWARWLLVVSAVVAGVLALVSMPFGIPVVILCAATVGLLFHPRSRAWFAARDHGLSPPPPQR